MSFTKISAAVLVAMFCISGVATAQCTDGTLSALDLTLNGIDPSSDPSHQITTSANGAIDLSIVDSTGANTAFILLLGSSISCGSIPAGAVLDQIDLGGAQLLLDGINSSAGALDFMAVTPFTVGFSLPVAFAGICGPAFQAVYLDSSVGFFFRTTDAGQICYQGTKITTYGAAAMLTLGDDDFVTHALDPVTPDIMFNGVPYSSLTISSNGVVAMVTGTASWTPVMAQFNAGFAVGPTTTANPGVSLLWSDLMRSGTPNGEPSWEVSEDMVTGNVTVVAKNQNYWSTGDPAGDASCMFTVNPGVNHDVTLDYTATTVGLASADNILIGLTDGDDTVGTDNDLSGSGGWAGQGGSYTSAGANDTVGELIAPNVALGFTQLIAIDAGISQWSILIL